MNERSTEGGREEERKKDIWMKMDGWIDRQIQTERQTYTQ